MRVGLDCRSTRPLSLAILFLALELRVPYDRSVCVQCRVQYDPVLTLLPEYPNLESFDIAVSEHPKVDWAAQRRYAAMKLRYAGAQPLIANAELLIGQFSSSCSGQWCVATCTYNIE